jgi:hypothetical protein
MAKRERDGWRVVRWYDATREREAERWFCDLYATLAIAERAEKGGGE